MLDQLGNAQGDLLVELVVGIRVRVDVRSEILRGHARGK